MNFFKTVAMVSSITDEEAQQYTLKTCPWKTAKYHRYGMHMAAEKYKTDAKSCMNISALQAIIADLDDNMTIDKCEFSLMCIGTKGFGKANPKTKAQWKKLGAACAKHSVAFTWKDIVKACKKHKWSLEQTEEMDELSFAAKEFEDVDLTSLVADEAEEIDLSDMTLF